MDLDLFLNLQVEQDLLLQRAKKVFKKKISVLNPDGTVASTKALPANVIQGILNGSEKMRLEPGQVILRTVEDLVEALNYELEQLRAQA